MALPSHNKCQHDEGEDSNAVLSLLCCLADTKKGSRCDDCGAEMDTRFYLCVRRRGCNLLRQKSGDWGGQSNLKMFAG